MPASIELVKIALKAYGDGDVEIALALSDPMLRWDDRASRPDGDLVWGHDEVRQAMRRYLDGWQQYGFELEEIAEVAAGKVVGICRERGLDGDGVSVDRRFGGLWVVEEAKIVSWSTYLTPKEAVRAARELAGKDAPRPPKPKNSPALKPATPEGVPDAGPLPVPPAKRFRPAEPPEDPEPAAERPRDPLEAKRRAAKARALARRQAARS